MTLVKRFREFVDANDSYIRALKEEINKLNFDLEHLNDVIKELNAKIATLENLVNQGSKGCDE